MHAWREGVWRERDLVGGKMGTRRKGESRDKRYCLYIFVISEKRGSGIGEIDILRRPVCIWAKILYILFVGNN